MPDLAITRLREAQGQLRLLASSYGQFSQSDQENFVKVAEMELAQLRQTLEELRGVCPIPFFPPASSAAS